MEKILYSTYLYTYCINMTQLAFHMMRWFIVQLIHIQYIFASTESLPRGTRRGPNSSLVCMLPLRFFSNLD